VAVELGFGLTGVLSTVTMTAPYEPTISTQLIRLQKPRSTGHLLSRVNPALRACRQFDIGFEHEQLSEVRYRLGARLSRSSKVPGTGSLMIRKSDPRQRDANARIGSAAHSVACRRLVDRNFTAP
jgi:hypothetical protein